MDSTSLTDIAIQFSRLHYTNHQLIEFYKALVKPRMIEEKMLILLRQGRISKWFSGIGQEAIAVGSTLALENDEFVFPLHRNLGVFTSRNMPLSRLFAQWQGKEDGYTKGRDRSFHFGTLEHHIIGMISHLGPQMSVADGVALAHKLSGEKKVSLAYCGDGATSEGEFHEAINVAAVWDLPVIFMIENNGYGLSTPNSEQYRCEAIVDKAIGYGIEGYQVDGNNIIAVYELISKLAKEMRENPRPVLIEALTFRMRGHEEASGTKYVPQELMDMWAKKDPVANYEIFLIQQGVLSEEGIQAFKAEYKQEMERELEIGFSKESPVADLETELADVYYPHKQEIIEPKHAGLSQKRFIDAISDGLRQSMQRYPQLVLMGQDIAEYGGAFKITEGFVKEFGKQRVRNTPLCESAIVGTAMGLSLKGYKAMMEMQFADFATCGFNQIINYLAKVNYRWGANADVVIRMPTGANTTAGPFHSQSNEAWFFHTPGLKIVYPSNPYDAKGLINAAIEDPNPVMFFEHKYLYRSISDEIPDDYYTCPIGKASLVTEGNDMTIVTYGLCVHWAKQILEELNISADLIDLRTLLPWDTETVSESVKKTGKVLVVHEDTLTGGIGAEIAAWITENLFKYLDAPVMREGSLDTPVPFTRTLEQQFLPFQRIKEKIVKLKEY